MEYFIVDSEKKSLSLDEKYANRKFRNITNRAIIKILLLQKKFLHLVVVIIPRLWLVVMN